MNKKKTGNNKFLKQLNETDVLNLIRINKAVSRADLSLMTGLTPTATGGIISNLLKKGIIHETGTGKSKGGRKPILLELKSRSFFSIGIDFDVDYIHFVLIDLLCEVVSEKRLTIQKGIKIPDLIRLMADNIKEIMAENSVSNEYYLGIGISVPGIVNDRSGEIILAPNLEWRNINIKPQLQEILGLPVFIENESRASAIAEHWIGACQGSSDFVCANIKSGIGTGVFINGKLYRGATGSAGELGHVTVDENGIKCGCGNYGCLETLASTSRIVEKAGRLLKQGALSGLEEGINTSDLTLEMVITAARKGDETARGLLLEASRYLGIAISNIVNILNPEKIVIGKDFVKFNDLVIDHIRKIVESKALKQAKSGLMISASQLGEKASVLGAAIIPVKTLFGQ